MIMLDVSGSMDDNPDGSGGFATRLDLAKHALNDLITDYEGMGPLAVQIVTFHDNAHAIGTDGHWMDATTAQGLLNGMSDYAGNGATNYDAALATAIDAFGHDGKIDGGQNVSYFLSDGVPTVSNYSSYDGSHTDHNLGDGIWTGSGTAPDAASGITESQWTAFLNNPAGDGTITPITSFAVGLGSGTVAAELAPIASGDGLTNVHTTLLTNLPDVLHGTLSALPVSGNLLTSSDPDGSFGADGGHVQSIAGDTTQTAGAATPSDHAFDLNVTGTHGGILHVNSDDGDFLYTPPTTIPTGGQTEVFNFTLIDGDGDTASAQLSVLLDDPNIPNP
jgi:hypothetical protein